MARVSTIGTETKTETKQNQAKVKDRAKTMFWSILCYSEFSVIKKHVLKLEKLMDKAHAYELFIFGDHVWTMFGPCLDHVLIMFGPCLV